jgi:alpha-beta hydrolase superfamily lysophospholipase
MSQSYLSPLTASDGDNIAVQDWPLLEVTPRGTVLVVHGLGEHAARYGKVADVLNQWGYSVRGFDHYGHGESGGVRGGLPQATRLIDDLADVVDSTRRMMGPQEPLFLLGHSMGGLVAAQFVLRNIRRVEGLVLSSPALNPGLTSVQKALLSLLGPIMPNLCVGNGLKQAYLCRDLEVIRAYRIDPLVHDRISVSLTRYIAEAAAECQAAAAQWRIPTLLVYAGNDHIVNSEGSQRFAANAPKAMLQSQCFEAMYHEILNDPQSDLVLQRIQAWLEQQTKDR